MQKIIYSHGMGGCFGDNGSLKARLPQNSKVEHSTIQQSIGMEKNRLKRDWLNPCVPYLIFSTVEKTG